MRRGGEVLHCIHSGEVAEGCGRAPHCRDCVVRNSVEKVFRGEEVQRELTKMTLLAEGRPQEVYLSVTASLMGYEGKQYTLLILEDVTWLKKTEEELGRRAAQLAELNNELEAFSYSVAHDLRAPLRAITGFSEALIEDYGPGLLDATAADYLARIVKAGGRMSELIDDLLKLSRITRDDMRPEHVNLSSLAREVACELRASHPDRAVSVSVAEGITAAADTRLIRVVMENLLRNAWKFTAKAGAARIEFGMLKDEEKAVYFVRDNGAGFDMRYADKLFTPFQRLHGAEEFPGSGIGLATVRRIIHLHRGKIWAEGAPGKGATIFFTLNETA